MEMKLEMVLMKREASKVYKKKLTEDQFEVVQLRAISLLQNLKITLHKIYSVMKYIDSWCYDLVVKIGKLPRYLFTKV